ncbi:Cytochrome P450 78A9 [Rhynchospora pubera]|uniref:Cytochrome P450 78A9 n=1 Tax=Rhynchospora pubera TaxID=906938 RepID=A0AAV8GLU1_9POAL|nr:Cytochrome P450 78A9 [Rhynchospora pubera]
MASTAETGPWLLSLSLIAKCNYILSTNPYRLLLMSFILFTAIFLTALLHWAHPGGPAWGRYISMCRLRCIIPGPKGFPFVGSMHLMTGLAHRKLFSAAKAHEAKNLMAFSLGGTRAIVTANPNISRDILTNPAFSSRPIKESAYGLLFDRAIGFAPDGVYWRLLRRISSFHLFSPKQIVISNLHREHIAAEMTKAFCTAAALTDKIEARVFIKRASLNNIMWSVFGKRYTLETEEPEMLELRSMVEEGYDLLGALNWSDHLPFLSWFDLQGIRGRCERLVPRVNLFVSRIIAEHMSGNRPDEMRGSDFVDVLLSLQESEKLSNTDIVAVLWEMVFRGTDTVAVLIEWILARLVLHQDIQARVHEELDRVVGLEQVVTESYSGSLTYLQAVIKEVLRMHPPGPLLSWARISTSDVYISGKLIPAGTTAMVNMWAITHDSDVWSDPMEFKPDRFFGSNAEELSIFGSDLRLAPFGSGRRGCPGKQLAMNTVTFWVASLLHEFVWLLPSDQKTVDLSEVLRLSCEMDHPLKVQLKPRRKLSP